MFMSKDPGGKRIGSRSLQAAGLKVHFIKDVTPFLTTDVVLQNGGGIREAHIGEIHEIGLSFVSERKPQTLSKGSGAIPRSVLSIAGICAGTARSVPEKALDYGASSGEAEGAKDLCLLENQFESPLKRRISKRVSRERPPRAS